MPDIPVLSRTCSTAVALIVPHATRRLALATAMAGSSARIVLELGEYPSREDLAEVERSKCEVVIVDLDDDLELAVQAIENLCGIPQAVTVMAWSARNDATLMRRSMQAGAREFLLEPLPPDAIREALSRVVSRLTKRERPPGKLLVFIPTKGGVGVTSLASNFAIALTKESGARVAIVDLDLPLGEVAAGLGMTAAFSVADALRSTDRLDRDLLSTLLMRHDSGLAVLASAEDYTVNYGSADGGLEKLFGILRDEFDYVVVDSGTCHGRGQDLLFSLADKLYLVTELTFPALRNAHRLLAYLSGNGAARKVEVVLNRFNSKNGEIDEASAVKAICRPVDWRIPNVYAAARAAEDAGVPLVTESSPITRALLQMAKAACGKPATADKKIRKFSLLTWRSMAEQET